MSWDSSVWDWMLKARLLHTIPIPPLRYIFPHEATKQPSWKPGTQLRLVGKAVIGKMQKRKMNVWVVYMSKDLQRRSGGSEADCSGGKYAGSSKKLILAGLSFAESSCFYKLCWPVKSEQVHITLWSISKMLFMLGHYRKRTKLKLQLLIPSNIDTMLIVFLIRGWSQ